MDEDFNKGGVGKVLVERVVGKVLVERQQYAARNTGPSGII